MGRDKKMELLEWKQDIIAKGQGAREKYDRRRFSALVSTVSFEISGEMQKKIKTFLVQAENQEVGKEKSGANDDS